MALVSRRIETVVGNLLVAASEEGICRISFPVELSGKWFPWFDKNFSEIPRSGEHPHIDRLELQLGEYLSKNRRSFDIPLDMRGTTFHLKVWYRLLKIPYGATITYGELAKELNVRRGSRAVGRANACNPVPIVVPCHRVTGASGQLVGFGGGIDLKERLLELEGARIPFLSV